MAFGVWVKDQILIPLSEIELTYVRSSGPGGQNVNKVNSKAVLRWNPSQSKCLDSDIQDRLITRLAMRLTTDGDLVLSSDTFRDQVRNREECLKKLALILQSALHEPKKRKKSRPSWSSQQRAKVSKKKHSLKKKSRGGSYDD